MSVPPPAFLKCFTAISDPFTTPQKFVSNSRRESSWETSSRRPYIDTPALLIHVSMRPKRATQRSAALFNSSSFATSQTAKVTSWPASVNWAASDARAFSFRATSISLAPFSAAIRAVTRPIPLVAPVRSTTCSFKGFCVKFIVLPRRLRCFVLALLPLSLKN